MILTTHALLILFSFYYSAANLSIFSFFFSFSLSLFLLSLLLLSSLLSLFLHSILCVLCSIIYYSLSLSHSTLPLLYSCNYDIYISNLNQSLPVLTIILIINVFFFFFFSLIFCCRCHPSLV